MAAMLQHKALTQELVVQVGTRRRKIIVWRPDLLVVNGAGPALVIIWSMIMKLMESPGKQGAGRNRYPRALGFEQDLSQSSRR